MGIQNLELGLLYIPHSQRYDLQCLVSRFVLFSDDIP